MVRVYAAVTLWRGAAKICHTLLRVDYCCATDMLRYYDMLRYEACASVTIRLLICLRYDDEECAPAARYFYRRYVTRVVAASAIRRYDTYSAMMLMLSALSGARIARLRRRAGYLPDA